MADMYQEGGFADDGAQVEPVTGNEVPPGSLDQEVRDDVDAKLSEGEYVIPADVVRFIGLGQIEGMIQKAKQGLAEMDANGRIGGSPVDEQGVPMEDDELTPEEMQMLSEALGQAPTGMAMGGVVQQPIYNPYQQQQMQYTNPNPAIGMQEGGDVPASTFNAAQYQFGPSTPGGSGGIEIVEYINTQTGETRLVSVMNGQIMGEIPEGFVRSTPETKEQARKNAASTTDAVPQDSLEDLSYGDDSESEQRREELAGQESSEGGFGKWASENYDEIVKDPLEYVNNQLGGEDTLADAAIKAGTKLATGLLGPVGAGLGLAVNAANELTPIANARAALGLAKEQNASADVINAMQQKIDDYEKALPRGLNLIDNVVAPGTQKSAALSKYGTTKSGTSTSTKKLNVPSATSKKPETEDGAAEERRAQERYEEFQENYEKNVASAKEDPYGQTTGTGLTVDDEDLFSPPPMAKGGLVARPSGYKSKVTKKKEKSRRGLGSK
jgi:hypothetical protein